MHTIAKLQKEPRCALMDEQIKKMWFKYTMEYNSAIRKDEILPFTSMWMELEGIMLSEIKVSQRKTIIVKFYSYEDYKEQHQRPQGKGGKNRMERNQRERDKP